MILMGVFGDGVAIEPPGSLLEIIICCFGDMNVTSQPCPSVVQIMLYAASFVELMWS